ncbi:Transcriptional regulator, PadR family [Acidobacteriia bacterium SbA2]|nr:Transcriptional regulator, PadR family [Acidobacteriia bacterium SbA2]
MGTVGGGCLTEHVGAWYIGVAYMGTHRPNHEWKKGSAELLILSLLEQQSRHGYDIAKLIEARSGGSLRFHVTTLYPLLYRLEEEGLVQGKWVEKPPQRRRRYYHLTPEGRRALAQQRQSWREFVAAIGRVMESEHA